MPSSVTNTSKNASSAVTNDTKKGQETTFGDHVETWAEAGAGGNQWAYPGYPITKDAKNASSAVTNNAKN